MASVTNELVGDNWDERRVNVFAQVFLAPWPKMVDIFTEVKNDHDVNSFFLEKTHEVG